MTTRKVAIYSISPALKAIVGTPTISRPQALKSIWAYIKDNKLQDPISKRNIIADDKLATIFGKKNVGFTEVLKLLGPHFIKRE